MSDQQEAINVLCRPNLLAGRGELESVCSYDRRRSPEEVPERAQLVHRGLRTVRYVTDVTIRPSVEMLIDVTMTVLPQRDRVEHPPHNGPRPRDQ